MCASKNFASRRRAAAKLFTAPLKFLSLDLDQAGRVVQGRVVRVLAHALRRDEGSEIELLRVHVSRLGGSPPRDRGVFSALGALTVGLGLGLLEVEDGELIERGHVRVVDGQGALQVLLRALHVVLTVLIRRLAVALELKRRETDQRLDVLELRVADDLVQGRDGAFQILALLEVVQRELGLGAVKARVRARRSLELRARFRVLVAALIGQAGVVQGFRQRLARGFHIQLYELYKPNLSFLRRQESIETIESIDYELRASKQAIEEKLGKTVDHYSYAYAFPEQDTDFVQYLEQSLRRAGYTGAVSTRIGTAKQGDDLYLLKRIPVNSHDDEGLLRAKLEGGYDWLNRVQVMKKKIRFAG